MAGSLIPGFVGIVIAHERTQGPHFDRVPSGSVCETLSVYPGRDLMITGMASLHKQGRAELGPEPSLLAAYHASSVRGPGLEPSQTLLWKPHYSLAGDSGTLFT